MYREGPTPPIRFCQLRLNDVIARWPGCERVGSLPETRPAPRLADLAADRSEHVGDRFAAKPRIGTLDLAGHATQTREHDEWTRAPGRPA